MPLWNKANNIIGVVTGILVMISIIASMAVWLRERSYTKKEVTDLIKSNDEIRSLKDQIVHIEKGLGEINERLTAYTKKDFQVIKSEIAVLSQRNSKLENVVKDNAQDFLQALEGFKKFKIDPPMWLSIGIVENYEQLIITLDKVKTLDEECANFTIGLPDSTSIEFECLKKGKREKFEYKNTSYLLSLMEIKDSRVRVEISKF